MPGKFEGKVALVTGAASGIGKATAIAFAKEGAKLVLADKECLNAVAEEIKDGGGEAVTVVGDASKEDVCKNMVDNAVETFGGLHVAFNNHGVAEICGFVDITEEQTSSVINTNLKSLVFCFKYQIPAIAKSGDKGSIIVTTSAIASRPTARTPKCHPGLYAATKAGAEMLMKYAAIEGAESGVRVNSVAPGYTLTPMLKALPDDALEEMLKDTTVLQRGIKPEEIAKVVMFLASDDAAMVTGSVYTADCGMSLKN